jgi:HTH-type transcriptional regulator xre|nr:MAG TPA: helix-turn-helix domain protein [Caudoviricetes sp.]
MFLNFVCLAQICGGIVVFYDVYLSLCKRNSKKPSVVAAELGINKSNVSNWKNNGYTPRGEVLQKIADYFGVTTDYLLTGEKTKKAPTDGERIVSDDDIKFALFGGDGEITDAMYDEVKRFAQMVKLREEAEKEKK